MATKTASLPLAIERHWTAAEYRRLPEGPPYYELEDGELLEMVRPRRKHQLSLGELYAAISAHVRRERLGKIWLEVAVELAPTRMYIPDLSFLLTENLGRFADDVAIQGPPDLVVEVVSPSTARRDRSQKLRAYHQAGVPWYWLVESDTLLITEYRHTPDGYLVNQTAAEGFTPALFPGLTLRLADSFAERNLEEEPHE